MIATILSVDQVNPSDVLGVLGASAALMISDIPFNGPVGVVRVGQREGGFITNPTYEELATSDLDLVVAGVLNRETNEVDVIMVEAGANQVPEEELINALEFSKKGLLDTIRAQIRMQELAGKPKREVNLKEFDLAEIERRIPSLTNDIYLRIKECASNQLTKKEREEKVRALKTEVKERYFTEEDGGLLPSLGEYFDVKTGEAIRRMLVEDGLRVDGRRSDEIRAITSEVGLISRTHGSGLFTRGQTQALTILTLGAIGDVQKIDDLSIDESKRYMHHYNFPPFSVGETGRVGSPRRRSIGHGALAERALLPLVPARGRLSLCHPPGERGPLLERLLLYGFRLRQHPGPDGRGSSHEGFPGRGGYRHGPDQGRRPGDRVERHPGDGGRARRHGLQGGGHPDGNHRAADGLKGTRRQRGDPPERPGPGQGGEALHPPQDGGSDQPAAQRTIALRPRVLTLKIPVDKIKDVIGSGGKTIHRIVAEFDIEMDVEDDGRIFITAKDMESGQAARKMIEGIIKDVEPGEVFEGKVTRIMTFGAFVEFLPGKEGLVHISKLSNTRIDRVEDVVNVGDSLRVEVAEIDKMGRVNLFAPDHYDPSQAPPTLLRRPRQAAGRSGPAPGRP